ncbi:TPA-induced transmembrane protein [Paramormyrops kingsleyae]|uniref:TPA-induced transmembrane protein n=1 Tax=Paramormyrops kingsleyae TaxID=1676925 RepID=UPI003B974995
MNDIMLEPKGAETSASLENNNTLTENGAKEQENGDRFCQDTHNNPEEIDLLGARNGPQIAGSVGDRGTAAAERRSANSPWNELNRIVIWKLKLWMVILIIFLVIFLVIVLSLVLYSVVYQDEDEKFDRGSFVVERLYTGTFRLINQNYTEDLHLMKSPQSTELSRYLQKKLGDIYTSSPALGRYFSSVGVKNFSNGSITAHFWLMFHMPQDHTELVQHTLSRSMVQNVLRQSLYEQEFKPWEPLYIDPDSSRMAVGNTTLNGQSNDFTS